MLLVLHIQMMAALLQMLGMQIVLMCIDNSRHELACHDAMVTLVVHTFA